jgi:hypothetical protein
MTDSAIAAQLKAPAEDYDRRAENASRAGAAQLDDERKMQRRHSLDRLLSLNASSVHDLMGSFTGHPSRQKTKEPSDNFQGRWNARPVTNPFIPGRIFQPWG